MWLVSPAVTTCHAASPQPLQLVVAVAPTSETFQGVLRLFSRTSPSTEWHPEGNVIPVLLGRNGLAWGRGLHPAQQGLQKAERDGRSPEGRFRIGLVIGNDPVLPAGASWTAYHQKTARDAWIDDPSLGAQYNRLYTLKPGEAEPSWFASQRMRLNDPAYRWLVVVEHNTLNPLPGAGSAIFLHIRRGPDRPTAGCTAMAEQDLKQLILWLKPESHPEFVLLSQSDYLARWKNWQLPPPEMMTTPVR